MRRKKRTFRRSGRFWEVRHEAGTDHSRVARQRGLPPLAVNGGGLDEFTIPYYLFRKAGYAVFVAAPHCAGRTLDLELLRGNAPEYLQECWKDGFDPALARLFPLESVADWQFDAVFYPGGRCCPGSGSRPTPATRGCSAACSTPGRWSGAVSYGPAALLGGTRCDGHPLVFRRGVTGLSNAEEDANPEDSSSVRFRLEDRLKSAGAHYLNREPWLSHVVVDGNLVSRAESGFRRSRGRGDDSPAGARLKVHSPVCRIDPTPLPGAGFLFFGREWSRKKLSATGIIRCAVIK